MTTKDFCKRLNNVMLSPVVFRLQVSDDIPTPWEKSDGAAMRVLLISANTEQITMPVLPVGLACVAAAVEKSGHDVRLLNLMVKDGARESMKDAIGHFNPEAIGMSVRNIDDQCMRPPRFLLDGVKNLIAHCHSLSQAPIILGGAGYSIFPRSALEYLGGDMGIRGEGERALPILLDHLARSASLSEIPGIVLPRRAGGGQSPAAPIGDLDGFPLPDYTHLSIPPAFEGEEIWIPFQTRRGCPMQCSYCSTSAIEGRAMRKRSAELAAASLAGFAEAGFTHFFFVDNTFNIPVSYAKELCDNIISRKLDIRWRCILYPWKVDEELAGKMAQAGCFEVSFGFESGSREILRSMNKKFRPEEVVRISEVLGRAGIGRLGFLLLGGPGETRETVGESLSFADSLGLEAMKVTAGIRIYPDTALARSALNEGVITPSDDLLFPTFYMAKNLDEPWVRETIAEWVKTRPHWIA